MPEETQQQPSSTTNGTPTPTLTGNLSPSSVSSPSLDPEIVKQYPVVSRFKTQGDLAKSYDELNKLQSRSLGKIPDDKSTPEERTAFYQKIGVPEKPEGYEFKRPDGVPIDESLEGWFRKAAHENGIPKGTAEKLYDGFVQQAQGLLENASGQAENFKAELKKEWGYSYDRNVRVAGNTLGRLIAMTGANPDENHELVKFLNETHLGDHPALIRFFHALAPKFGEDQLVEPDALPSVEDVSSAKEELAALKADKKGAYWSASHPGHKDAVARAAQLYEIINAVRNG